MIPNGAITTSKINRQTATKNNAKTALAQKGLILYFETSDSESFNVTLRIKTSNSGTHTNVMPVNTLAEANKVIHIDEFSVTVVVGVYMVSLEVIVNG